MNEETRNRNIIIFIVILMLLILAIVSVLLVLDKNNGNNKKVILEQKYISENKLIGFDKYYFGIRDERIVSILGLDGEILYLDDFGVEYDKLYKTNIDTIVIYKKKNDSFKIFLFDGQSMYKSYDFKTKDDIKELVYDDVLLGFISEKPDITTIYNLDGSTIELEDISIVPDYIVGDTYKFNSINSLIAKKKELCGAIDILGNTLINFDYEDLKNTTNSSYIAKLNNKYGVINKKKEVIIPITNDYIVDSNDGYVIFNKNIELYNKKGEKISHKKIKNKVKDIDIRDNNIFFYDKEYSDLLIIGKNMYVLKNKLTEIAVDEFYYDGFLVIYSDNTLSIYDEFFNKILDNEIDLDKINKVYEVDNNDYYLEYTKNIKEFKVILGKNMNKSISNELIYKTSNYLIYKDKDNIVFKSYDGQVLETISSNDIIVNKNSIVLDNVIYKISIK